MAIDDVLGVLETHYFNLSESVSRKMGPLVRDMPGVLAPELSLSESV
jgi:hypothetical protein